MIRCRDCQTQNWSGAETCRRCGAELYTRRQATRGRRLGWIQSFLNGLSLW
ncbi:hypothetical protein LIP_0190 [Limnochorda pilosa]|uniref:RanBP2-type domain-containing protein n=1 Tax=Limnochorda pilosa TaxID=1555112 RepID=A0A0K2SG79_LIMPI|nr:hypothetical protein LIP_0190 [Limnochorda pilosa]